MAATVATYGFTGTSPGTGAAVTTLRFKNADDNTVDTNNPVIKPSSGTNYSFWKSIALFATVAPSVSISNVKIYSDGTLGWAGCQVDIGDQQTDTYIQATGSSNNGDEMVASHSQISSKTDLFTYTSGSPLSVTLSASWADTTGRITMFLVLQLAITSAASGGVQAAETMTWQYDEV